MAQKSSSALDLQQGRIRLVSLRAENERLRKELAHETDMAAQAHVACIALKAEIEEQAKAILQFRKMDARDYMVCGKCGKEYHTLNLFDCPWCEQGSGRTNMLTRTVKTTKQVPVEIIKFEWSAPVTNSLLCKSPCSACKKPIGQTRWGIGWYEDNKGKRSMRLCESCGIKAEQALGE